MGAEVRVLLAGTAEGEALVLTAPISFWGGVDAVSGAIIDERHPQFGSSVGGRVLVMPHGKGSSSASSVLAECLRLGTGPCAIVLDQSDEILLAGALVAGELYDRACPIVVVGSIAEFQTGSRYRVDAGGVSPVA